MTSSTVSVPPDESISDLGEAVDRMYQLLFLFTLWGDTFRLPDTDERRGQGLLVVANRIDAQLANLGPDALMLQDVFSGYPDWVNESVSAALDRQLSASEGDTARRRLAGEDGDFAASGAARAASLGQVAGLKRDELRLATDGLREVRADVDWGGLSCDIAAVVAMGGGAICVISEGKSLPACAAGLAGAVYLLAAC